MFTGIMVPLDGSPLAESVLPLAATLARAYGGEIVLLRASQARPSADITAQGEAQRLLIEEAQAYLGSVSARPVFRELQVSTHTPYGSPAEEIIDEAAALGIHLVVMATHGRTGVARWAFGSVADRVLQAFPGDLLVVRPSDAAGVVPPLEKPERIVVPLDGSGLAERVLETAGDLASRLGAELLLIQVLAPPDTLVSAEGRVVMYADEQLEAQRAAVAEYLSPIVTVFSARGVPASWQAAIGQAADEIERVAADGPPSMVVMSTHGRSGVSRWLLGSVADRVLRHSHVPVLMRRAAESERLFSVPTGPEA